MKCSALPIVSFLFSRPLTLAIAVATAFNPFAAVAQKATFFSQFGTFGGGNGQFNGPVGIVSLPTNGQLMVTEFDGTRVQRFDDDAAHTFLGVFGAAGAGDGQYSTPFGIASDEGFIYIADRGNNRVQKVDVTGFFVRKWGTAGAGDSQFNSPRGIAVRPLSAGGLTVCYVTDFSNNRVQVFDRFGVFLFQFGSAGALDGQFNGPNAIALNQTTGQVYVADRLNNRVQRFDAFGGFQLKWGTPGSGNGQFGEVFGIAVDAAGKVYVSDSNNRIQRFSADGVFEFSFGGSGSGPGQFNQTFGLAPFLQDGQQRLAATDYANHRVQIFTITEAVRDTTAPRTTVTRKKVTTSSATARLTGKASDVGGQVARVEVRVGKSGSYKAATGKESWSFTARSLKLGANQVTIRAIDTAGNTSPLVKATIVRKPAR